MSEVNETVAAMTAQFGEAHAASYLKMLRATASLVNIGTAYLLSADGTPEEAMAKDSFERMIRLIGEKPEASKEIMESLIALVVHMRKGKSAEEWFTSVGVDVLTPIEEIPL